MLELRHFSNARLQSSTVFGKTQRSVIENGRASLSDTFCIDCTLFTSAPGERPSAASFGSKPLEFQLRSASNALLGRGRIDLAQSAQVWERTQMTVSYTHLTLPTILLV